MHTESYTCTSMFLWVGQPRSGYLRYMYLFHTPHQRALPSYATCGGFSAKGKVYIYEDKIRRFQKHMVKFSDVSSQKSYLPSLGSQASSFHIIHNYHSYNFRPAYPTYILTSCREALTYEHIVRVTQLYFISLGWGHKNDRTRSRNRENHGSNNCCKAKGTSQEQKDCMSYLQWEADSTWWRSIWGLWHTRRDNHHCSMPSWM